MSKNLLKRYDEEQSANRRAARIIIAEPEQYPGLMNHWACAVLGIVEQTLPLFDRESA